MKRIPCIPYSFPHTVYFILAAIVILITCLLVGHRRLVFPFTAVSFKTSCSSAVGDERCYVATYSAISTVSSVDKTPTVVDGHSFVFAADYLSDQGFPIVFNDTPSDLSTRTTTANDIVFVTAADTWYFMIDMDAIALVQRHFPNQLIIFYDLSHGLRTHSQLEKIKRLCNVEYRWFDFSRYPTHVKNLKNYAWKAIIIHEVLQSHKVVFWMDSSIRFRSANLDDALRKADTTGGLVLFDFAGHSIFAATHYKLYEYLPINRDDAINTEMYGACAILVYREKEIYDAVISWWFLCALTADCIAPTTDLFCKFGKNYSAAHYASCHRYDQSALNVLLVNHFTGNRIRRSSITDYMQTGLTSTVAVAAVAKRSVTSVKHIHGKASRSSVTLTAMYVSPAPLAVDRGSQFKENISVCDERVDRGLNNNVKLMAATSYFK